MQYVYLASEDKVHCPPNVAYVKRFIIAVQNQDFLTHFAQTSEKQKTHHDT